MEKYYEPVQGNGLILTIDEVIQHYTEKAVQKAYELNNAKRVTVVAMDPKTGDILSMASKPDYDPNDSRTPIYPYYQEELDKYDLKNITEDEVNEFSEKLSELTAYIDDNVSANMMMQELINDVLLVLYTSESQENDDITAICSEVVSETNLMFTGKFAHKTNEELEAMFVKLEGKQEELYHNIMNYDIVDQILDKNKDDIIRNNLEKTYEKVSRLPLLNSDSLFVEFDKKQDKDKVNEEYLEKVKENLYKEFIDKFANSQRLIKKSIMSATLSELPVFFNNISELQDFVYNCLKGCTDMAEKKDA